MFLSDASSEGSQYALRRIDSNWRLVTKSPLMRPVVFGEGLSAEARLALFSGSKPDRFFTVIKFWLDETSGVALALKGGVPTYQVEDEEGTIHLLLHLPIEEENEHRWCLWRPDHAGFDSRSMFEGALSRNRLASRKAL